MSDLLMVSVLVCPVFRSISVNENARIVGNPPESVVFQKNMSLVLSNSATAEFGASWNIRAPSIPVTRSTCLCGACCGRF
ncbi:MAG: hypothetical protein J6C42_11515 [Clostridia bacterium]|nr:hypothetical protein [Clostridia bacterium]